MTSLWLFWRCGCAATNELMDHDYGVAFPGPRSCALSNDLIDHGYLNRSAADAPWVQGTTENLVTAAISKIK